MNKLTPLQESLESKYLRRNFHVIQKMFLRVGINLQEEFLNQIMRDSEYEDYSILDVGCGSGEAIEHATRGFSLSAAGFRSNRKVKGVGVDINPLGEISSEVMELGDGVFSNDSLLADLRSGDACNLPVEDESVDLLYSSNTLTYVPDNLRALEEGYRVLRPGGVAFWDARSLCVLSEGMRFKDVLEASSVEGIFQYYPIDEWTGVVVCRKPIEGFEKFKGFPFKFVSGRDVSSSEFVNQEISFYRGGVYESVLDKL